MNRLYLGAILALTATAFVGCTSSNDTSADKKSDLTVGPQGIPSPGGSQNQPSGQPILIRSDYTKGEVTSLCDQAISEAQTRFDAIAKLSADQRTTDNTLLAYELTNADFGDKMNMLTFMGYVHIDPAISAEGSACEEKVGAFMVDISTRRDIYLALKDAVTRDAGEARLKENIVGSFEKEGLKLNDADLATLKTLLGQISKNEAKFSANLNIDTTSVSFTADELKGVSADFLSRLQKDAAGKFIVTTKSTDYTEVNENAVNPATRKAIQLAYLNRGTVENTALLQETTKLRAQTAKLLGFDTWADYRIDGRMAGNRKTVLDFMNSLKGKLALRNRADLDQLLAYKKEIDPTATKLEQWDIGYMSHQLLKRDYSVDEEKIREYFPADVVIAGMFQVYSQMLGVTYIEVPDAKVWSPDVKMFEIRNTSDNRRIGYFYTDFIPREGKYGHAAAFTMISGREINGTYNFPVSAIVANLTPPSAGKPSLLSHDDVETIFHEFGHIMHQTLTRAKYASMSGSNTAQDFVEAPSQMLENWVWSPEVLPLLSGHYLDHSQKLPTDMLNKMLAARKFGQGIAYTKQLLYGLYDLTIHSGDGTADVTTTYDTLYRDIVGEEPLAGAHFAQTFGHLMGGYDAGYYGYLWSEVYAQDMFTVFEAGGLLSPVVGAKYRTDILERGSMTDAIDNLRDFLGREPNSDAFFKKLGI